MAQVLQMERRISAEVAVSQKVGARRAWGRAVPGRGNPSVAGGSEEEQKGQRAQSQACRAGTGTVESSAVGSAHQVWRQPLSPAPEGWEPGASRTLALWPPRAPGWAGPELTSRVGTPGPQSVQPNEGVCFLCDPWRSGHLRLMRALVTSASGFMTRLPGDVPHEHAALPLCPIERLLLPGGMPLGFTDLWLGCVCMCMRVCVCVKRRVSV